MQAEEQPGADSSPEGPEGSETAAPSPGDRLKPYQWKPGQSGNPRGKPKGKVDLLARIRRELLRALPEGALGGLPDGSVYADALARRIVIEACKGDFRFAKELIDREEGTLQKPKDTGDEAERVRTVTFRLAGSEPAPLEAVPPQESTDGP